MHAGGKKPRDFDWAKLSKKRPLYSDEFEIFLVQVKSDSPAGRALHVDPIAFFEKNIKEMGLRKGSDTRAMVLRVNAELSANPKHRSELWITYPGSTNALGIQYKYDRDMVNPEQS